jgi:hypothetical protein
VFHHLSFFPALETFLPSQYEHRFIPPPFRFVFKSSIFALVKGSRILRLHHHEEFMEELTRFASDRKSTTSAWLHSVVILHREGKFPSIGSIRKLGEHVPVVDVRIAEELPADLI